MAADGAGEQPGPEEPPDAVAPELGREPAGGRPGGHIGTGLPTRHRGVLLAGLTVGVLFVGALVIAFLGTRVNAAAVPGSQPIASLAVTPAGYLVGTIGALYASPDGKTWTPARLPPELVAVDSDGVTAYVLAAGTLRSTRDLATFTVLASSVTGTVIAAAPGGGAYIASGPRIVRVGVDGRVTDLPVGPAKPAGLLALAVSPARPGTILAGGPVSGLWQSDDNAVTWHRVLGTPTLALLIDRDRPERLLLGTPGGVLVSEDAGARWRFTELRLDVHGLSQENGQFFAVASDRVVYRSANGDKGWVAVGG